MAQDTHHLGPPAARTRPHPEEERQKVNGGSPTTPQPPENCPTTSAQTLPSPFPLLQKSTPTPMHKHTST